MVRGFLKQIVAPRGSEKLVDLWVLTLVAAFIRGAWWATQNWVIENEGAEYCTITENWFGGNGYMGILGGPQILFPPLYPFLNGLLTFVVGDCELAGRTVAFFAAVALVPIIYSVTNVVFGRGAAIIAGAMAAAHPFLVAMSSAVYVESLYGALLMFGAYWTLRLSQSPQLLYAGLSGLFFGLAYLTRPEGLAYISLAFLAILANAVIGKIKWTQGLALVAMVMFVSGVLAIPYITYLSINSGGLHIEGKSIVNNVVSSRMRQGMTFPEAARGLNLTTGSLGPFLVPDHFKLARASTSAGYELLRSIASNAPSRAITLSKSIASTPWLGSPVLFLFALLGFILSYWWRDHIMEGLIITGMACLLGVVLLSIEFLWPRYFYPVLPLTIPWFGAGVYSVAKKVIRFIQPIERSSTLSQFFITGFSIAVVSWVVAISLPATYEIGEISQSKDKELKRAGQWIAAQGALRPRIMGISAVVPYYAGGVLLYLPYSSEDTALQYINQQRPNFIVLREGDEHQAPYLTKWLHEGIPSKCTRKFWQDRGNNGKALSIYAWTCT